MALTRQRESAQVLVARETARDPGQLAWQMARGEVKAASVAWATREELAPALRAKVDAAEARAGKSPRKAPRKAPGKAPGKADDGRGDEGGARVAERGGSDGGRAAE